MKRIIASLVKFSLIASFLTLSCPAFSFAKGTHHITIATANINGVYYSTGGAICRAVNIGRKDQTKLKNSSSKKLQSSGSDQREVYAGHGIRCGVESTSGSVANINALRSGDMSLILAQSDRVVEAYGAKGVFSDQSPFKDLRNVISLYTESLIIVVPKSSDINKIDDIKGKRVNLGSKNSGTRAIAEALFKAKGISPSDLASITSLSPSEQAKALCEGKIDVMMYVAGNPNGVVVDATQLCDVRLLDIGSDTINKLIEENPSYSKTKIPGGLYAGNPNDINTFGVTALLATSSSLDSEIVYQVVKSFIENLSSFSTLHPVFASINKDDIVKNVGQLPFHPGALRAFKEYGLVK